MTQKNQDYEMMSGDDFEIIVTITESDLTTPKDLTGALAVKWEMSKKTKSGFSSTPILQKFIGSGVAITDAPAGKITITLAQGDTEGLKGDFYHEVEVIDSGGRKSTTTTGTITISPDLIQ